MNIFSSKNPEAVAQQLTPFEMPLVREYLGIVANAVPSTFAAAERHPVVYPHLANTTQQVGFAAGVIATAEAEKRDRATAIIDQTYEMMGLNGAPTSVQPLMEAKLNVPDSLAGLVPEDELLAARKLVKASYVPEQGLQDA